MLKKLLTMFAMSAMFAVMVPMFATSADAQTRRYRNQRYVEKQDKNIYQKHRNLINIGIGAGAGALVGGLLGGKKGALWGTVAGAGAGAVYTYKINPKTKKYERVYLRRN